MVGSAIEAARRGGGPQLVVGDLLRLVGHGEHDDAAYVNPKLKSSPLGRDCLKVSEEFMIQKGWASGEQITRWRAEAKNEVDVTAAKAARTIARSERGRLEGNLKPLRDTGRGMITYLEAIRSGLAKVWPMIRAFFCMVRTLALSEAPSRPLRISPKSRRVLDSPLSEDAIVGVAIGAAIEGMRPIIEMQFADFLGLRHEPNSQSCRDLVLSHRGALSDRGEIAIWRHAGQRTLFTARAWSVVCPLSRSYCDDSRDSGGCIFDVDRGGGDRRSGALL